MSNSMLLVLVPLFLLHQITRLASAQLDLWSYGCFDQNGNYTSNSTYKSNLDTLLTKIPSTNISYGFYNFSAGQDPDQVNAIALCRGDVELDDCHTCLNFVIPKLTGLCPNQNEAIGWSDSCMVRYSDRSILGGKWENNPTYKLDSGANATDIDQFANGVQELLRTLPNKTAGGDSRLKFATGEAKISDSNKVYALMQCTPDLPPTDCLGCSVKEDGWRKTPPLVRRKKPPVRRKPTGDCRERRRREKGGRHRGCAAPVRGDADGRNTTAVRGGSTEQRRRARKGALCGRYREGEERNEAILRF